MKQLFHTYFILFQMCRWLYQFFHNSSRHKLRPPKRQSIKLPVKEFLESVYICGSYYQKLHIENHFTSVHKVGYLSTGLIFPSFATGHLWKQKVHCSFTLALNVNILPQLSN